MKYAMLVMDLDGTLLQDDKQISERSLQALQRCKAAGIRLVPASARPRRGVLPYARQIDAEAEICHNGALIQTVGLQRHFGIEESVAAHLLQQLRDLRSNIQICAEINDMLFANFDTRPLWPVEKPIYTDFACPPGGTVDKLIVKLQNAQDAAHISALLPQKLYLQTVDGDLGLIMNRAANKANAVRCLAQHWGIPMEAVAAFGDDANDTDMLRECGCGVAMGNALPQVKAAANTVTAANTQHGVAKWIEEHILA